MIDKVGGRKAAACLTGLIAVVGVYLYTGSVNTDLVDAIKFLVTAYVAGNVGSDAVAAVQSKVAVPSDDRITTIMQSQDTANQALTFIVKKISGQA